MGQDQAVEAVRFGISVRRDGHNLFAVGPPGVGKQSVLGQLLSRQAAHQVPAEDWCYINNFDDPRRPRALRLPAGKATLFRADMERTVAALQGAMRAALEGDEYQTRKQKLIRELEDRQDKAFRVIERQAKEMGVSVVHEQDLFLVSPLREGKAMLPAEFEELPETEQSRLNEVCARAEDAVGVMLQEFNDWGRQQREALETLERATAAAVGSRVFGDLRGRYSGEPAVLTYLSQVEANLADSAEEFIQVEESVAAERAQWRVPAVEGADGSSFELRATVNVLIDHVAARGAPVVYEDHPTHANLMGRIEHAAQLSGFLGARYATSNPLSLTASLVFEQSYAVVEGDSASLAEACALLSALADVPVKQSLAITGSMNQHGEVQAIGSVNEKIEGFFDVCSERGLTGAEGVIIPSSNARHLMLRSAVTAAVRAGMFHVWTVDTPDDALTLLMGRDAGQRDDRGRFAEGTVNAAVASRLSDFAESSRRFRTPNQPEI